MKEILFTRQRHEADKAGPHYDVRLVHGDKAYSWATKKELPEHGKSIILWEQPVHDATYALSKHIEIPKGQYGSGTTTLDFVRKATVEHKNDEHFTMTTKEGERYLFKKVPGYGDKAWLFRNLGMEKSAAPRKRVSKSKLEQRINTAMDIKDAYTSFNPNTGKPKKAKTTKKVNKNKYLKKVAQLLNV